MQRPLNSSSITERSKPFKNGLMAKLPPTGFPLLHRRTKALSSRSRT
ncbi:hypothetical protein EG68_04254 [Paragonimus skrjabini miyazakii]|uniref:Uncharacterized protein n=1 Tax=Paragonimus skrjabini miyazakii TaxID=59628 RepID=A0A8S9YUP2_9TREM|nr:hypothetical protein EG68_04254 [Paragonimus skrjabini miyazakii]